MKIEYITKDGTIGATEEIPDTMSFSDARRHALSTLGASAAAMISAMDGATVVVTGPDSELKATEKMWLEVASTRRVSSAMVATAIGSLMVPDLDVNDIHVATKGHICGSDNGKPDKKIQKRNDLCCCGSGRKAKRCCVYFPQQQPGESR